MTNILILSCGTRNKIVQYFVRALTNGNEARLGNVIATDMSDIAPAVYEADKFYRVPCITDAEYLDVIFDICKKDKVNAVISLIDPELSLLAMHREDFAKLGVVVLGSSYELCEMSLNKYKMYQWLVQHGYKCARSFRNFEEFEDSNIGYPVFVKPMCGSASIAIAKANNKNAAKYLFEQSEDMLIQEFLQGQEIGADVYIDLISGEVVSIFTKKKILMRAGETDKAVSFKDQRLFNLIEKFVKEAGYRGQLDIDIFDIEGEYYISEVNPRFGGGYPHAYECGCNHIELILNNLQGKINPSIIGNYESDIYMMKYNEIKVLKRNQY